VRIVTVHGKLVQEVGRKAVGGSGGRQGAA